MSQIILVVDDDSDTLTLIGITLQRRNFEILKAQGGQQALDLLKHEKPDLVVLDVMMPEMDGYEVCRRIKADPRTAHLPVIMLTAKAQTASQLEGFRSGAADYITKPVHPQELVARIQSVLERARSAQAQRGARVISISGAKGGVGATTLAVNVALALAAETNTILADFEPGGTAALHLGLVPSQGLGTLLEHEAADIDRASVEAVLAQHPSGLRLLSGADEPLDPDRALVILNHLASLCEACVLDLGWSVSAAGRAIAPRSDEFVLAIDSDRVTLTQAARAIHTLNDAGLLTDALKLVWVNRLGTPADIGQTAIRALLGREPAVAIGPAAEAMTHALELGQPLVLGQPDHPAAAQLRTLASALMNTAS